MPVFNNALAGAAGQFGGADDYIIERSLRFDSGSSKYLSRTPASAGNRKKWTWSGWVKRSAVGNGQWMALISAQNPDNSARNDGIWFDNNDRIYISFTNSSDITFVPLYRDASAWMHIFVSVNTESTGDRIKCYVNGAEISIASGSQPSQNDQSGINNTTQHSIGRRDTSQNQYLDAYLADVHFLDGITVTDPDGVFGEFDDDTGVWNPKAYTGSYGTQGYHLDFSDNSSISALGNDAAGSNNWTPNNFQVDSRVYATGDYTAVNGVLAPTDDPFWIDILPTGADMHYADATNTDNMKLVHDGLTTTSAYWVGNLNSTYGGNVKRARFDLTSFGTITSCRVYGGFPTGYVNYKYRMLDSSKTEISGSEGTFGGYAWHTMQVTGNPKYIEISCEHTTSTDTRHRTHAIEVNGVVLVNGGPHLNDSFTDTPTNGDSSDDTGAGEEVSGNYCTLNVLSKDGGSTLSNGNLEISSTNHGNNAATFFLTSGKWYWEGQGSGYVAAICGEGGQYATASISAPGSESIGWWKDGPVYWDGNYNNSGTVSYDTSDIIGTALDMDNGVVYFYKNGTLTYTITFGDGTVPNLKDGVFPCYNNGQSSGTKTAIYNFGQRAFVHSAPSGYKALCTANFEDPLIQDPSTAFDILTWSGNGNGARTVSGLNLSNAPDLVWSKTRNHGYHNNIFDSVRGYGTSATGLITDYSGNASGGTLNSATASSLTFSGGVWHNENNRNYVSWAWDAGSSNTSVSAGGLNSSIYNQSERWRDALTSSNGFTAGYEAAKAFDGVFSSGGGTANNGGGGSLTFQPANSLTVTSLELECYSDVTLTLPDGTTQTITGTGGIDRYRTANIGSGFSFTGSNSITLSRTGGHVYLGRIKINGKELVDDDVTVTNVPQVAATVRANPTAGISIVSYTGTLNSAGNASIPHGLNNIPSLIICKDYGNSTPWIVQHEALATDEYLHLNANSTPLNSSSAGGGSLPKPTSNVFYGSWLSGLNTLSANFIGYCFAPVKDFSAFGTYEGNQDPNNGHVIWTGFTPAFILVKYVDSAGQWYIYDHKRSPNNVAYQALQASQSDSENTSAANFQIDILSSGFKMRQSNGPNNNGTYIYAAFAKTPFKYARAY